MSEKESYKSPELNSSENDEVEIDWMGYLRKLIAARKALLWSVIIGVVLGIVIASCVCPKNIPWLLRFRQKWVMRVSRPEDWPVLLPHF